MDTPATNYRMTNGVLFEIQHHLRRRLTHSSPAEHCKLTSHSNYCTDKKRGRVNHPAGDLPQGWTRQQQNTSQYQKSNRNHPEHTQSIYGLNYLKRIRYSNDATGWTLGSSNAGRGTFFFSAIRTRPLWRPPSLLLNGYLISIPKVQPSSANVTSTWRCTSKTVKFTLWPAKKARRGSKGTLSLASTVHEGGWSTPRPGRFTPGKDPVPTA